MRIEIREGGDGHACWNGEPIRAYVAEADGREQAIAAANPDVIVVPGLVKCYGCEVQEYHYGTKCTAMLTKSLFKVRDQIPPREADAAGSLLEIPGLATVEPGSTGLGSTNSPLVDSPLVDQTAGVRAESGSGSDRLAQEPPDREPRRRGLFGRR